MRDINREAVPLIIGILFPVILVGLIALYLSGYDFIVYFTKIDLIYFLLIVPFGLGVLVAVLWFRNPKN